MTSDMQHLLASRRFLPMFVTMFLGAANDNLYKSALVMLITFGLAEQAGLDAPLMVTAAAGVFIAPFFLFSAWAGQLADRFDKAVIAKVVKLGEIAIMAGAALGFHLGDPWVLMGILFFMGTQSAVFGPVKYSILPQHLSEDELIPANALFEGGTFLAILIGTIAGGLLVMADGGPQMVSALVVGIAALGFAASLFIPTAPAPQPDLKMSLNIAAGTARMLGHAAKRRDVFLAILGISWFWLVGATFLSQFPTFAKVNLGGDEQVVTLFLAVFSIGIALGSALCSRFLKGEISAKYVPFAALLMTAFMADIYWAATLAQPNGGGAGAVAFLSTGLGWRITLDLLMIAVAGGLYIVPLYAILQSRGDAEHRARDIAANNVYNALFMVVSALGVSALLAAGWSVPEIFLGLAIANACVAVYIVKLLPDELLKAVLRWVFKLAYKAEVRGLEHWQSVGEKAVIVVNHVSFLDGALLAAFLPEKPLFAINTQIAKKWWVKPFLSLVEAFPMDPTKPMSMKDLIGAVRAGQKCVIFPEGRITVTGALMKVYEGPAMVADKAGADVLPVRIDGAEFSPFSRLKGKVRVRWFPKITLTVLPPRRLTIDEGAVGAKRRTQAGLELYDVMSDLMFASSFQHQTLFDALLDARAVHGGGLEILEDVKREPLDYTRLITGTVALGRALVRETERGERVGVLLPNANGAAVTIFALAATGRVPAMLNFSAGPGVMASALNTAQVRVVLTSRAFIDAADLHDAVAVLGEHARVIHLEDVKAAIGLGAKLAAWAIARWGAHRWHRRFNVDPADAAAVLFTSGSEGAPKGVVLSHDNLLANRYQLAARIDFNPTDTVFNALPVFHSFGLSAGLLLPVLSGVKTVLYPSPLHYRIVPELVYDTGATVMFGTDTFLAGYAKSANPYDFFSVRYVCAGAEKVKPETRQVWMDKFGLRILEGYGATETAPVLAFNTPMHHKAGTVGRLLPGIEHRLDPVDGIDAGGELVVRGPNVMKGYLLADDPGRLVPPDGGWYDTGDIVDIDAHGFVTIQGRAKRFAKVAGEMVSLGQVEDLAAQAWPEARHAAVTLPDPKKGEQVVLATEQPDAARDALLAQAREQGVGEIMVPKAVVVVDELPLLGAGKVDYPAVERAVRVRTEG